MKIYSFEEFNTNESKLGIAGAVLLSVAINFATLFYHDKNKHDKEMKNKLSTALKSTFSYKQDGKHHSSIYVDDKKILDETEFKNKYASGMDKLDQDALYCHYEWAINKVKNGKITYDPMKDQLTGMPKHVAISVYQTVDTYQDDIDEK